MHVMEIMTSVAALLSLTSVNFSEEVDICTAPSSSSRQESSEEVDAAEFRGFGHRSSSVSSKVLLSTIGCSQVRQVVFPLL